MIKSLKQLSVDLKVPFDELQSYADEDDIGGWQEDGEGAWHIGSMMPSEGKLLYAIVRALRPSTMVEFGCFRGCSTKHILSAMVKNRKGHLYTYDMYDAVERNRFTKAQLKRWTFTLGDALIIPLVKEADIVWEDTEHTVDITRSLVLRAKELHPRLIICHDGAHYIVGAHVREGFRQALGVGTVIKPGTDHCGFIYKVMA